MRRTDALQRGETRERVSYRWACPYCAVSRVSQGYGDREIRARAKSAVAGHVSASAGDDHGPRHSRPEDFDPAQHVEHVPE